MKNSQNDRSQSAFPLVLAVVLGLAFPFTSFGDGDPENCEFDTETTECNYPGSVSLSAPAGPAIYTCVDSPASITANKQITQGSVKVTTYYRNCDPETHDESADPNYTVTWTVTGVTASPSSGSGLTAVFTPTSCGAGSVNFTCTYSTPPCTGEGTSGPISVGFTAVKAELQSVEFTSDHEANGVSIMKDNNSNWAYTGTEYSSPEWVKSPAVNNPISHTKNSSVTLKVTLSVCPASVTYDLKGDGGEGYFTFVKNGNTSTGGDQEFAITANAPLPNEIGTLTKQIAWTVTVGGKNCGAGASGEHKIYVTHAYPVETAVTEKRIAWACEKAKRATTDIAAAALIHVALSGDPPYEPGEGAISMIPDWWMLLEPQGFTFDGECDDQAFLMKKAIGILGVDSEAELQLVRASLDSGEGNCLNWESRTCSVHGDERLQMDFGTGGDPSGIHAFAACCVTGGSFFSVWPNVMAANDYAMLGTVGCSQRWCFNSGEGFWTPCNQSGSIVPIPQP